MSDNPANRMEIKLKLFQQVFRWMEHNQFAKHERKNELPLHPGLIDRILFICCIDDAKGKRQFCLCQNSTKKSTSENNSKQFYDMNYCVESIFTVYPLLFFWQNRTNKMMIKCLGYVNEYFMGLNQESEKKNVNNDSWIDEREKKCWDKQQKKRRMQANTAK